MVCIVATVNTDLFSLESFVQILKITGGYFANINQAMEGCGRVVLVAASPLGWRLRLRFCLRRLCCRLVWWYFLCGCREWRLKGGGRGRLVPSGIGCECFACLDFSW